MKNLIIFTAVLILSAVLQQEIYCQTDCADKLYGNKIPLTCLQENSLKDINPDIMLFGGDIVEGDREDGNLLVFENLLKTIKPKYGVFTVLGNHEYYAGQDKGSFFDKAGMKVLCDTILSINNSFRLGGRYDSQVILPLIEESVNDK